MYYKNDNKSFNFILIIILVLFCWNINTIYGQNVADFPGLWTGKWKGTMEIYNGPKKVQSLAMQLHILATDSSNIYSYRIIYGPDTVAGDRPYLLKIIDADKGKYLIDEQNSIKIEASLLGNMLTSCYEVEGNLIYDILEKRGDTLYWRLISGKSTAISNTGNTKQADEVIPPVKTYPPGILQCAALKK